MTGTVSTSSHQSIDTTRIIDSNSSSGTNPSGSHPAATSSQRSAPTPAITSTSTTSPLSGAVPAQLPVRSYATATKTATPPTSAGASAPAQNAKPAVDSQMNGAVAQGGSQSNNPNMPNGADHGRKPSVVINASGASGYTPNGGPVAQNGRPAISFGSMGSQGSDSQAGAPFIAPNPSLATPQRDARVITPTHSPSPIPQPAASGGRPPSSLQNANSSLNFGSMGPDNDMMRGGQLPQGPMGQVSMHERRTSSQGDMNSPNMPGMNRPGFVPNAGRGRQSFPQQPFAGSPGPNFRPLANQGRPNMAPPFQQAPPGSPYARDRATPQQTHAQPMPPMGGHPQMAYGGYPQHLGPYNQGPGMYGMPSYDTTGGYYTPYYTPGFAPQAPQSPRPQYPTGFPGPPGAQMQPPFHPPGTPGMVRTPSQASERPPSSLGGPQTPMQHPPPPSQTPTLVPQGGSSNASSFVRPPKKSTAIKITDAQGNALNFAKPSPAPTAQAQPGTPVIVSTPNAPTPPPRAPSAQHNRTESKATTAKSSEETKNAFAEQVKRQLEEDKRKQQEEDAAKSKPAVDETKSKPEQRAEAEEAASNQIKQATVEAEKAAAVAAGDSSAQQDADAAAKAMESPEDEKKRKEREEEERIEREIAEMEAAEREEEEREKAFQEKKAKERAAAAEREKERAAKADEDLKRQEREAEERELAREKEREKEKEEAAAEPDDEAKKLFASLKRPTLGPGASAPESGRQTPASEAGADSSNEAPSETKPSRAAGAQKPKPAHLKLETSKPVERAEPTPGMQALKSARFLEVKEEPNYPDGFKSPNPALNQNGQRKGRAYDKDFLLQFQSIFKEKPSIDWEQKVKETLGPSDEPGSARPQSARTPSGQAPRQNSNRPASLIGGFGNGPMGNFGGLPGNRTLPPGTTSEQRFRDSNVGGRSMGMNQMARTPSGLGMNAPGVGITRNNSSLQMAGAGPRQSSQRGGRGNSKRDSDRARSSRQEAEAAAKMPLTAHMEITPLEKSTTGWKASSLGPNPTAAPDPSGNMSPDIVQRKVKAALNKMTPEKFDKISDQILEIAAQSKNESDGRTLRQVIQLTFEKACDEAHWAGMYAEFCSKMLATMSPEIRDETIKDKHGNPVIGGALFRKYLLNRCQEEFERGWQGDLPGGPNDEDQEIKLLSEEYYVAAAAKRRGLGLIQFIGQLYKLRMLTLRIMHECVMRLLNFEGDPDEAAVENLTTLLKAVGATMEDEDQGKPLLATYFSRIEEVIMKSETLPSRPKFMIMDLMDLRKAGWKGKNDSKGPKTIQQIHEEAEAAKAKEEADRQRTNQRGPPGGGRMSQGRGDARNFSGGMPPPVDYQRTNVNADDLRRLQGRVAQRQSGGGLGPGGSLGPSGLGARSGSSRRSGLGGASGNTTRTNTPPVEPKKEEPMQQNAFSALAALDPSGEVTDNHDAASPPATRNGSKSPHPAGGDDSSTA